MILIKWLFISLAMTSLWAVSGQLTTVRLAAIERAGLLTYGPLPDIEIKNYYFQGLTPSFNSSVPISRIQELPKKEFESLILNSLEKNAQKNLGPYISAILDFSVDYQVDPFWIISIMMVESNFNVRAVSPKNAMGLMQIKPDTAQFLYQLMQKEISPDQVAKNMHLPEENIEVGIFYLRKLLYNFRLNHRHATVAYNIGPNRLRSRLVEKNLDIDSFSYLQKVKQSYALVSSNYTLNMNKRPIPFELTYVVPYQGQELEEKLVSLLSIGTSENLTAYFH